MYGYVENNPLIGTDRSGLVSDERFATPVPSREAGAKADVLAASGGVVVKYIRGGANEWGGRVCKEKCPKNPTKPYYYTGPTEQKAGKSYPDTFEKCLGSDPQIGNHYAHPDGTDIPVFDQQQTRRHFGGMPLMLGVPAGPVAYPHAKAIPYGRW